MVLAAPGPLLTPPPSSSPPKTPCTCPGESGWTSTSPSGMVQGGQVHEEDSAEESKGRREWNLPLQTRTGSYGTYLPQGIYGARLLFFVSARTNKRHHHHRLGEGSFAHVFSACWHHCAAPAAIKKVRPVADFAKSLGFITQLD